MYKILRIAGILIIFLACILLLARNNTSLISPTNKLQITASFYPMAFFASEIGGTKATVFTITPASAEPHDYEPTTQDIARIVTSNMLVLNGGSLEPWGDKIKQELQGSNVIIVSAGAGLANKTIVEDGSLIQDPHIWQNPLLAKQEVATIEKGYEKIDPKDTAYFQINQEKINAQFDQLDQDFRQGLAHCQQKDFVTSHAAFGYLAAQYGINQVAISGVSPDEEPSSQKLAEIADLVKKEHINVIFFESLVSPKLSDTIAQETGAKAMVLDPLEGITPEEAKHGANYFSIMRQNLAHLQVALQCN